MTGAEFTALRESAGWSIRETSRRTRVAVSTLRRWEASDGSDIGASAVERLRERVDEIAGRVAAAHRIKIQHEPGNGWRVVEPSATSPGALGALFSVFPDALGWARQFQERHPDAPIMYSDPETPGRLVVESLEAVDA